MKLELCPKPIQTPSQFFTKTDTVFPKNGACFSPKRTLCFPKTEASQSRLRISSKSATDFPKIGEGFHKNQWRFSWKSVADFPKVGGRFSDFPKIGDRFPQNRWRWRISPKSATDFPKIGARFSQNLWRIFPKSVADFPKICGRLFLFSTGKGCAEALLQEKILPPNIMC